MAATRTTSGKKASATPKARKPAAKKAKTSGSKSKSSAAVYTRSALRDRLKKEIMAGDKGGQPGQWSARKSQLLAAAYKKAGGGYKTSKGKKAEPQKHLDSWTEEGWTTADGKPAARGEATARYLPETAWDELTPGQKKATDAKKRAGSRAGKRAVANTKAAKSARKSASKSS